jgi:hypothetical protein
MKSLYEVFQHPNPAPNQKWAVQMQTGLICFRTQKLATEWADACKRGDAEKQQGMIENDLATEDKETQRSRDFDLHEKLVELGARALTEVKGPNKSTLEFYRLNGQAVIVQWFADNHGYEVYAPIFNGDEVKGTFDALDALAAERYATR